MRVLAAGDLHCYWPTYSRICEDGIPSRLQDWRRSADALLHTAIKYGVKVAVFPGDYFPNSRPSPLQILEVAKLFQKFEETGIRVVGCKGNHDDLGPGQESPVDIVDRIGHDYSCWGISQPKLLQLDGLDIAVLPYVKGIQVGPNEITDRLMAILRALIAQSEPAKPKIVIGHWAISGCRLAAGNSLSATEPTLPLGDLQALPVQAVIMGHIHTPQVVATNPIVLHTGILERHDFGEERNQCGCYILDLESQQWEFIELPARRFVTLEVPPEELPHLAECPEDIADREGIQEAVVRVTYRATEEQAKRLDHGAMIRALEAAGAHQVAGVFPEIINNGRTREASITETTGPLEALNRWLSLRGDISEDMQDRVRTAAASLLKEVAC